MNDTNEDKLGAFKAPISRSDFLMFGMDDVAYIKCVKDEQGERQFAIYAADGTEIVMMEHKEAAVAAIRHHEMEPVSLH
ncbi:MAG: DUF1150 family protein [Alphaproteobacteria bacterium]|nr:DUF1150 family protein [Alphaproteobacteria bacterium SS10]